MGLALSSLVAIPTRTMGQEPPLSGIRRIVFVGDSITYSGQYVEFLETYLRLKNPELRCEFLNLGLPSETVSGLSEPGHAGGKFPRPDLHERFERILNETKPDLVVACYGMNDGIYHPFSEERFRKFQDGIRFIRDRSLASGTKVVHLTPPVFDPEPIQAQTLPEGLAEYRKPFKGYDDVLDRYSQWLLDRRPEGWLVVDVHGPMKEVLLLRRQTDPKFRFANDGVHIDPAGHWIITRQMLDAGGHLPKHDSPSDLEKFVDSDPRGKTVLALVQKKQRLLKDAWLSAVGHTRPGMGRGLPLAEAEQKAGELEAEIRKALGSKS
ncbi:lysophospholipase [bacterium SCN 62-11]|nr:MAG: lysophospholipase [bacterium SCN 62-11]